MRPLRQVCGVLLVLLAGCSKADLSDLSEYREGYLLMQPHGWIELSLSLPQEQLQHETGTKGCMASVIVNGELYVNQLLPLLKEGQKEIRSGFLFPVAAEDGVLEVELDCLKKGQAPALRFSIKQDTLLPVNLDGVALKPGEARVYDEVSIKRLGERIAALEAANSQIATDQQQHWQSISRLLLGVGAVVIALLLAVLGVQVWQLRRRSSGSALRE